MKHCSDPLLYLPFHKCYKRNQTFPKDTIFFLRKQEQDWLRMSATVPEGLSQVPSTHPCNSSPKGSSILSELHEHLPEYEWHMQIYKDNINNNAIHKSITCLLQNKFKYVQDIKVGKRIFFKIKKVFPFGPSSNPSWVDLLKCRLGEWILIELSR